MVFGNREQPALFACFQSLVEALMELLHSLALLDIASGASSSDAASTGLSGQATVSVSESDVTSSASWPSGTGSSGGRTRIGSICKLG